MKKFILILTAFGLCSCDIYNNHQAIEIVKKSNYQSNSLANLFNGLPTNATIQDFANSVAKDDPNKKYSWKAEKVDKDLFLVAFSNENGWGFRWEVDVNTSVVKDVSDNDYLFRKYGFNRASNSGEFLLDNIITNKLKVEESYDYYSGKNQKQVVYIIDAEVVNNTKNVITSATIEGRLNLIFKEKTISVKSTYNTGFKKYVSKSSNWNPGERRKFLLRTEPIEETFIHYVPEYVIFELGLKAQDPVGYKFDENVKEFDVKDKWVIIKEAGGVTKNYVPEQKEISQSIDPLQNNTKIEEQREIPENESEEITDSVYEQ